MQTINVRCVTFIYAVECLYNDAKMCRILIKNNKQTKTHRITNFSQFLGDLVPFAELCVHQACMRYICTQAGKHTHTHKINKQIVLNVENTPTKATEGQILLQVPGYPSIMVMKSQQQEPEVAGHMTFVSRKEQRMHVC